jgi:hypothetical protein
MVTCRIFDSLKLGVLIWSGGWFLGGELGRRIVVYGKTVKCERDRIEFEWELELE